MTPRDEVMSFSRGAYSAIEVEVQEKKQRREREVGREAQKYKI